MYLEYLRCTNFSLEIDFFRNLGLANFSPLEVIAKSLIPKSIPIVLASVIFGFVGAISDVSKSTKAKYLPVGAFDIVAPFIFPSMFRCITALIGLKQACYNICGG